ncbi:hypothetical protein [Ornithinimicrobium sp. W1665]|uniref:hypothetical protein n=1 Tax=Ornithinimicrobium sp. W1665 TaxID=3416666 RepID=UPI003D6ABB73
MSSGEDCGYNDSNGRFYGFIPDLHGTLVVEGTIKEDVMDGELPTAEDMTVVVTELQSWAGSIELP